MRDDLLKENLIYNENAGTLAERIDLAWTCYRDETIAPQLKAKALRFLLYAFNTKQNLSAGNSQSELEEMLTYLIAKKRKYQATNENYIPGKSPSLGFHTGRIAIERTEKGNIKSEVKEAIDTLELLDVKPGALLADEKEEIRMFSAKDRSQYRVNIYKGLFYKDGFLFDTGNMISHLKKGYASFTLNADGELSLFNHHYGEDKIKHTSMNDGRPLPMAGEIKIENGVLKSLSTQSGHHYPTLFNIRRFLYHLARQGVDITQADVITFNKPPADLNLKTQEVKVAAKHKNKEKRFKIPATDIYSEVHTNRQEIAFTHLISGWHLNTDLDTKKQELFTRFEQELNIFKFFIKTNMTPCELKWKIHQLKIMLQQYAALYQSLGITTEEFNTKSPKRVQQVLNPFSFFMDSLKVFKHEQQELDHSPRIELLKTC